MIVTYNLYSYNYKCYCLLLNLCCVSISILNSCSILITSLKVLKVTDLLIKKYSNYFIPLIAIFIMYLFIFQYILQYQLYYSHLMCFQYHIFYFVHNYFLYLRCVYEFEDFMVIECKIHLEFLLIVIYFYVSKHLQSFI